MKNFTYPLALYLGVDFQHLKNVENFSDLFFYFLSKTANGTFI